MKQLSNTQINAAEQMLHNAFRTKRDEIRKIETEKINKKFNKEVAKLTKEFTAKTKKLENDINKFSPEAKAKVKMSAYSMDAHKIIIETTFNKYSSNPPARLQEVLKKVNETVLKMKLGENLMEEMKLLIVEINKLK